MQHLPDNAIDPGLFVDQLFDWLSQRGNSRYDEMVTQLEHALQCANIATTSGASEHQTVAALLHDIGHLIIDEHSQRENFLEHDAMHELAGSRWLNRFFSDAVSEPVRLHVAAKRWLYTSDHRYHDLLSEASRHSLVLQGGKLSVNETTAFNAERYGEQAVALRLWDDEAKVKDRIVPPLETYRQTVQNCLVQQSAT